LLLLLLLLCRVFLDDMKQYLQQWKASSLLMELCSRRSPAECLQNLLLCHHPAVQVYGWPAGCYFMPHGVQKVWADFEWLHSQPLSPALQHQAARHWQTAQG
jgi:hypothetical protein